ncbi:MAG: endo-1,4-beta-xylanase [Dictyoglomus thermophilum]
MYRRFLVLILTFLILSIFPVSASNPLDFSAVLSFEKGSLDNFVPFGKVKISSVKDVAFDGEYSLKVENRVSTWDGCEVDFSQSLVPDITYQVSAMVYHTGKSPQPFQIIAYVKDLMGERFELVGEVIAMPRTWKKLTGEFKLSYYILLTKASFFVVSPNEIGFDYYVDKFQVLGPNKVEVPGILVNSTFESRTSEGWEPRGDKVEVLATKEVARTGDYSLFTKGRSRGWHGAQLNVAKRFQPGRSYSISVWVYQKSGSDQKITLTMERKYNVDADTRYDTIVWQKTVPNNTWVELSGSYSVPAGVTIEKLLLYVESPNATLEFFIDDIRIVDKRATAANPEPEIPSLYSFYKDYFSIGTAIPYSVLTNSTEAEMVVKHFNSITPENEMKPDAIQPREGEFTFTKADAYVKFAEENKLQIRGHTLVWHQQTPAWFFVDREGKPVSKEVLLKRLETHIKTLVGRYKGKIYAWDVVNEAIDPAQPDGYRRSKWYEIIGPEYIEKAFIWAHEADPNAKLFYNDYNTEDVKKRQLIYNLVKSLKEKGIPIHGIGIQGHIRLDWPSVSEMEQTIQLFSTIPGIEIHITELDMSVYKEPGIEYPKPPRNLMISQAYRYKEIFDMLKKYKDVVKNVTFWGLKDDYSWLTINRGRNDYPLLFDKDYQAKLSYWALVEPKVLPPLTQQGAIVKGTAVIDGKEDEAYNIAKPIVITSEGKNLASVKTLWGPRSIFIFAEVYDTTKDATDNFTVFFDQNNAKSPYLQIDDIYLTVRRDGKYESNFTPAIRGVSVREIKEGYIVEAEVTIFGTTLEKGKKIGIDFAVTDKDRVISWSDTSNQQKAHTVRYGTCELEEAGKLAIAKKGTPKIDGEMDDIWKNTPEYITDSYVQGQKGKVAYAKFRVLWDETSIYVYAEIYDSLLNKANANPWEQDSFEIFIDEDNSKRLSYDSNDAQYRVNFENVQTFGTNASSARFVTATKKTDFGYIVEAQVKMKEVKLEAGKVIGFDVQVNDADASGSRVGIIAWNEMENINWQNPSSFGNLRLDQ